MPKIPYHQPRSLAGGISRIDPRAKQRAEDKRFYGRVAWQKLRALKLATDPLCDHCEKRGLTVPAVHVHHVKARKTHPDLALDLDNLQGLCIACHSREEKTKPR